MAITLTQGLMLTLVAFICGMDYAWEAFFIFRPMVVAFFAGLVLNNVQLGLAAGAIAELSYLGLTTIGGNVPPNPLVAGMMTVVIAHTTGASPEAALGLSLPFALLMQWIAIFYNTSFAGFLHPLDGMAERGDTKGFTRLVLAGTVIVGLTYALVIFLSAYAMQKPIQQFVESFPVWLVHGFEVAGGLLPGVGLALLLRSMLNINNAPFLVFGFVMATFMDLGGILPVALVAGGIALLGYLRDVKAAKETPKAVNHQGGEHEGI